ncbi:hypothetical protein N328_00916, partial [Gavia stellata]
QPQETASRSHTFKTKSFKKSKICGICKEVIASQGVSCRGDLIAHRSNKEIVLLGCTDYRDSAASGIAACSLLVFSLALLPCCAELSILASSPWDNCG